MGMQVERIISAALASGVFTPEPKDETPEGLAKSIAEFGKALEKELGGSGGQRSPGPSSTGGGGSSSKRPSGQGTNRPSKAPSKSGKAPSGGDNLEAAAAEAGDHVIGFGKLKGLTVEQVFNMSEDETAEYGYGKSGEEYVRGYLADEEKPSEFKSGRRAHAAAVAFLGEE